MVRNVYIGDKNITGLGKEVILKEAQTLMSIAHTLDEHFGNMVFELYACEGKIITAGVGKSGIIAKKVASTLASLGTESFSLDILDALHGDLGMINSKDLIILFSTSGETEELILLLPFIKRMNTRIFAITASAASTLAKGADAVLTVNLNGEAPPLGLAPTCSTTAFLAIGDALAMCLARIRGFNHQDFALRHPSGALGKKLHLRVRDVMHSGKEIPIILEDTPMSEGIFEISSKGLGLTAVMDQAGNLIGVITDGDLRRAIQKDHTLWQKKASEIMTQSPKHISEHVLAYEALAVMEKHSITALCVLNEEGKLSGIVHLHDILRSKTKARNDNQGRLE